MQETLATVTRALRKQSEKSTKLAEDETEEIPSPEVANWNTACEFAGHRIDPQRLIYASPYSFCVLTPRPVVRGHGIVCPRRPAKALFDLTKKETDDLFLAVQLVSWILTGYRGSTATTVMLQQGEAAHQRLPHLFVHVVPRRANDFPCNDYIYTLLAEAVPLFDSITTGTEAKNIRDITPREGARRLAECRTNHEKNALPTPQPEPTTHVVHHSTGVIDKCDIQILSLAELEQQSREIRTWLLNLGLDKKLASR